MKQGNKNIFFWANYYIQHPDIGTTAKISAEIKTLRRLGFSVTYTAYLDDGVAIYDNNDSIVLKDDTVSCIGVIRKYKKRMKLIRISTEYVKKNIFDYCLLRINEFSPSYINMLKWMKLHSFVMMESLSYYPNMNLLEVKSYIYNLIIASIKWNKNKLKDYIDLMLTEGCIDDFYGIPCVEFGMGVDVNCYTPHQYLGEKNEINMIMVGCNAIYHGVDRIICSLIEYYKGPSIPMIIKLHLVGDLNPSDAKLIKSPLLKGKCFVYGRKYGEELDRIYNKCNLALGPLAQHRMRKKDTGLKTKEYFARGIPYIYSGEEVSIGKEYPYIMKVEDSEEIIQMKQVVDFMITVCNNDGTVETMRQKAKDVFSWDKIFNNVFRKVEQLKSS